MRNVDYEDNRGFRTVRQIPDDKPDEHAKYGMVVGPPEFDGLKLPEEVRIRLNNELFGRGIITLQDAKRRRGEVVSALQAALKLDVETILVAYMEG